MFDAGISLEGASDHGVSEALYLRDPDKNGIELSWDRPKAEWPLTKGGHLDMETRALGTRELLREPTASSPPVPEDQRATSNTYSNPARQFATRAVRIGCFISRRSCLRRLVLVGLILTWGASQPYGILVALACLIIAFVLAARAWWKRWTTEIFVTDRRVIFVHGFFDRQSIEVHMNQIESVDVDQTLLGRLFDYGDVTIQGTGNTYEPLRAVDRPIALRNEIIAR